MFTNTIENYNGNDIALYLFLAVSLSHLALLRPHLLALLGASWALLVALREAISSREAGLSTAIHIIVVELLLLAGHRLSLAHVHGLAVSHLAVLLVTGELVRVDHGKHLREALTNASDSLRRVSEWKFVPWHEFDTFAVHVNESLLAGGARKTTKGLLAEHCVLLIFSSAALRHEEVVEVLQVPLK